MKQIDYAQLQACLFLRIPPIDFMAYDVSSLLSESVQEKVSCDLLSISLTNCYYVKLFLAQYMRVLEKSNSAIIDELYEKYCSPEILNAVELPPTLADVLKYVVCETECEYVTIKETPRVISGAGTTGLRTWEAALFLLNFLNKKSKLSGDHESIFKNKRILELGTGTGLVSLALLNQYNQHQFKSITLTDGDSALLENLPETFRLNEIPETVTVNIEQLIWGEGLVTKATDQLVTETEEPIDHADIILAADVTYDASVVPYLSMEIGTLLDSGAQVAFIAATIRNEHTIAVWEEEISRRFSWRVVEKLLDPHVSELRCWFRKGTPEIRIYELRKLGYDYEQNN